MIRLLAPITALALLAGCATAPAAQPNPPAGGWGPGESAACNVTVVFGSYAMGIDADTFRQVDAWVEGHKALVPRVNTTSWGREGEKTMCLTTASRSATRQVYDAIERLIPRTSRRGPVEVRDDAGRAFQSATPKQ